MIPRQRILTSALLGLMTVGCHSQKPGENATGPTDVSPDKFEKIKDPPINAQTHFAAGQLAQSQGNLDEALAQYKKALKIKSDYLDPLYGTAVIFTAQKDYTTAIETWNRYLKASNGSPTAYSNLGFCQELAGNPPAAEAAYKAGIARDPHNEPCHVNYGLMLARSGKPNVALLELQKVLTPAKAHYDLASLYESQGKLTEARAQYRQAIELDPTLEEARQRLALLAD